MMFGECRVNWQTISINNWLATINSSLPIDYNVYSAVIDYNVYSAVPVFTSLFYLADSQYVSFKTARDMIDLTDDIYLLIVRHVF